MIRFGKLDPAKGSAEFNPELNRVTIDLDQLRRGPKWRRQLIALLAHELVHFFDWNIRYRCDAELWDKDTDVEELRASRVQEVILKALWYYDD